MGTIDNAADRWRSLMVGNSRWHWGEWTGDRLDRTWDDPQPPVDDLAQGRLVWAASVVPGALDRWRDQTDWHMITLADIPIGGLYGTLGVDRALAAFGAGRRYGFPAVVIDGGTAMTLTAVDPNRQLIGGAIAPGLGLQLRSLTEKTAALPIVSPPEQLPELWAQDSVGAIASGVAHGVTTLVQAWIRDWRSRYPRGAVVLTGGDGPTILRYLRAIDPDLGAAVHHDPTVIFAGIAAIRGSDRA
ncbi:MAG: pantothenate kinase [Limnothrix sp. BL-A-16]